MVSATQIAPTSGRIVMHFQSGGPRPASPDRGRDAHYSAPPHRSVRAQFGHTACMGVFLSRVRHVIFVVLRRFILLFDPRREHSSVPTEYYRRRRAQRRSRTALVQRRRRLVLDQCEHGGRLPVIGWLPRDDPRGACHWPRAIAANHARRHPHAALVFPRTPRRSVRPCGRMLELTRNQVRLAPEYKRSVPVVVVGAASSGERATRSGEAATPER
jgi:hypothetical protein